MTRRELDKLAVYMGAERRVTLADAEACVGDSSVLTLDGVAIAACAGNLAALERGVARAYLEGAVPVAVLRAMARHLHRLHRTTGALARGRDDRPRVRVLSSTTALHDRKSPTGAARQMARPAGRPGNGDRARRGARLQDHGHAGRGVVRPRADARRAGGAGGRQPDARAVLMLAARETCWRHAKRTLGVLPATRGPRHRSN